MFNCNVIQFKYIVYIYIYIIHSFLCHVQNATIPCPSQELLPFLSVTYFFLPLFSTYYSSILFHLILPSISWSNSQSCCSKIHISIFYSTLCTVQTNVIYLTLLSLL